MPEFPQSETLIKTGYLQDVDEKEEKTQKSVMDALDANEEEIEAIKYKQR